MTSLTPPSAPGSVAEIPSIDSPGFYHLQAGELFGPFTPDQLRQRVAHYQILDEDTVIYQPGQVTLSGKTINGLGHLLRPDDTIEHVDPEVLITTTGVLSKNRRIDFTSVSHPELLLAKPPRRRILGRLDKIAIWTIAILLVWTLVVPVTAWFLTRQSSDEQGLGSVNGIKLHGDFEEFIFCDTLGLFEEGSDDLEYLRSVFGLVARLHHAARHPTPQAQPLA
ncbi:MAG: hypothetical protein SNJ84_09845 [Verrucomicrobiia bacterium]